MENERESGPALLRALRRESGMTQDGLAARAGVHTRTVRGLETGKITTPRRTSLDLLAQALSLDVGRHHSFLAAWGVFDTSTPHWGAGDGTARMEVIEAFLAGSRRSIQTITLNELIVIGANRRTVRRTTQEVVYAVTDLADSRSVFYDPTDEGVDIDAFHLSELQNCSVRRELRDPSGSAKLFDLQLARPLMEGETQIVTYTADFETARVDRPSPPPASSQEIAGFLRSPTAYVLEVRFDDGALPTRCEQIFQSRPTGPVQTVGRVKLSSTNTALLALEKPAPGGHGIAWFWDSEDNARPAGPIVR